MAAIEEQELDLEKLQEFVFRAVDEVGATLNTALVVMGDELGLYRAMAGAGPLTSEEVACALGKLSCVGGAVSCGRPSTRGRGRRTVNLIAWLAT